MILRLFRRAPRFGTIASLYGTIVAQARMPTFYQDYRVPDTVDGRFEMVVLHAVLLLHRLKSGSPEISQLGQGVFDLFCSDMDGNLREMGVGDLSVPRRMRRIGEAFYGRQAVYEAGIAARDDGPLAAALARNVFGIETGEGAGAGRLAAYMRDAVRALAGQADESLSRADVAFPDPATVAIAGHVAAGSGKR